MVTVSNDDVMHRFLYGSNVTNRTGSFSAEHFSTEFPRVGAPYVGYLPHRLVGILNQRFRDGAIDAVVYSYSTPIAWRDNGVWIIPDVRYSTTTSGHQYRVRYATDSQQVPFDAGIEEYLAVVEGLILYSPNYRGGIGTYSKVA